ncbi:MAG: hypothetical protein ACO3FE_14045 [Planctomycetaceae bacterium]
MVIEEHASIFEAMEDPYFRARGEDVRNIGLRLLKFLIDELIDGVEVDLSRSRSGKLRPSQGLQ